MQTEYTKLKVHNEIELCETADMELKQEIERVLLRHRISYYIKWRKQGLLWRAHEVCIICVNESVKEEAELLVRDLHKGIEGKVNFLMKKSEDRFF